jgi:hypothetical protein
MAQIRNLQTEKQQKGLTKRKRREVDLYYYKRGWREGVKNEKRKWECSHK